MTIEEAHTKCLSRDCHCVSREDRDCNYHVIIDKIYNDLESRTCENCKYYGAEHEHISHPNYRTCINTESFTYMQEPNFKDGCNNFERMTDVNV